MKRARVLLPPTFSFSTVLTIRITDLNYGGHAGNDVFMSLAHEARQQFLIHHGYSEMNFAGAGLIMADAVIEYKHELYYGNEIKISVTATGFDKLGFDIYYLLEIKDHDKFLLAGKIKTGMMCYDYSAKKRMPVPAEAIDKLSGITL